MADHQDGDGPIPDTEYINANDPEEPNGNHRLPINKDPPILGYALQYMQGYGWFILLTAIVLWYVLNRLKLWYMQCQRMNEQRGLKKYDALTKQQKNFEQQESAMRRMQEQHDTKAAQFADQLQLREKQKREERIQDWDKHQEGRGYRSKLKPKTGDNPQPPSNKEAPKKKEALRSKDYNPLTGEGSLGARPERRFRSNDGGG